MSSTQLYCDVVIPHAPQDELTYTLGALETERIQPGDSVLVMLRGRPAVGIVFGLRESSPVRRTLPVSRLVTKALLTDELLDLVRWLAKDYCSRLGVALGRLLPRGVEHMDSVVRPQLPVPDKFLPQGVWVLDRMRRRYESVVNQISASITRGSVLLLLPQEELARWLSLLRERFSALLVEYHSRLRLAKLRQAWTEIRWSRCRLVVGVRSAVLAPAADLAGIIMVDEHNPGYKEERQPRFHSRDVAVWRANRAGCPLLIFDRTPSLETWSQLRAGVYQMLETLGQRETRPNVFVVDMRRHRGELFSPRLLGDKALKMIYAAESLHEGATTRNVPVPEDE
ncbi:MAG: hypothetical protein ABIK43_01050, partial [candidate division WOR-3 bacterium]